MFVIREYTPGFIERDEESVRLDVEHLSLVDLFELPWMQRVSKLDHFDHWSISYNKAIPELDAPAVFFISAQHKDNSNWVHTIIKESL